MQRKKSWKIKVSYWIATVTPISIVLFCTQGCGGGGGILGLIAAALVIIVSVSVPGAGALVVLANPTLPDAHLTILPGAHLQTVVAAGKTVEVGTLDASGAFTAFAGASAQTDSSGTATVTLPTTVTKLEKANVVARVKDTSGNTLMTDILLNSGTTVNNLNIQSHAACVKLLTTAGTSGLTLADVFIDDYKDFDAKARAAAATAAPVVGATGAAIITTAQSDAILKIDANPAATTALTTVIAKTQFPWDGSYTGTASGNLSGVGPVSATMSFTITNGVLNGTITVTNPPGGGSANLGGNIPRSGNATAVNGTVGGDAATFSGTFTRGTGTSASVTGTWNAPGFGSGTWTASRP